MIFICMMMLPFVLFACSKNDDNAPTKANFDNLGIASVTINGKSYNVKEGLLDGITGQNMVLTGSQYTESTKKAQMEYAIILSSQQTLSCVVQSKYTDVLISVNAESKDNIQTCTVQVSRKGYEEVLIYKFVQKTLVQ